MSTNNTPARYISAKSWNGTEFYFNTVELTWDMADNTVLTMAHNATDADLLEARMAAKRESFLAEGLAIHEYVEC